MQKNYWEVEAIIEERIAEESKEWELDSYDIGQIRLEAYKENGWDYDPKPYEEEEESSDDWVRDPYTELGMSPWDFF